MDALAPGHVLVVVLVALVVLGPSELPKVVRGVARFRRELVLLRRRLDDEIGSILNTDAQERDHTHADQRTVGT
jgi:Sec-independent protein translocase protein TatA